MLNSSFILLASDNGGCPSDGSNNFPKRGGKFDLFDGGVRVPAFVYSPMIPDDFQGIIYDHYFHSVDWLPTILKLADPDNTVQITTDGVDHSEYLLASKGKGPRLEVLLGLNRWSVGDAFNVDDLSFEDSSGGIIYRNFKYIMKSTHRNWYKPGDYITHNCSCGVSTSSETDFLFDLKNDPLEEKNLIDTLPDIAALMKLKLRGFYDSARVSEWRAPEIEQAVGQWMKGHEYVTPWHRENASVNAISNPVL